MKRLFLLSFAVLLSFPVFGNESSFPTKEYDDLFVLEILDSSTDFGSLNAFVDKYADVIKDGRAPVYVTGYTNTAPVSKVNSESAAAYVQKVIDALKAKGLADKDIVAESFSGSYDQTYPGVIVRIGIPQGYGKGKAGEYRPAVQAVPYVSPSLTSIPVAVDIEPVKEPKESWDLPGLYLRTNMLFLAAATPNVGLEWRMNDQSSLMINGGWARWKWDDSMRRYYVWYVLPEYRRYLGSHHRWYIGLQAQYGEVDIMLKSTGYQGEFYGGSITGGYNLPIGHRLSLDFNLGLGYTMFKHDKYRWMENPSGGKDLRVETEKDRKRKLIGPNHIGVSLVWHIAR